MGKCPTICLNKDFIDGAQLKYGHIRDGALYSPTVLDYVSIESELVSKETFGPVAPVLRVKNLREAIFDIELVIDALYTKNDKELRQRFEFTRRVFARSKFANA